MFSKDSFKQLLSAATAVALVGAFVFVSLQPAMASGRSLPQNETQTTYFFDRRNKVLIHGVLPNQVVSVYGVDGSDTPEFSTEGVPNGQPAGDYLGPLDGKPLEIYIPLSPVAEGLHARQSRLFLWSAETGWQLIAALAPLESFPDTEVLVP
jgi:hypothetical protein